MKRSLLAFSLLTFFHFLSAQTISYYTEDFGNGPGDWTVNTYLCESVSGGLIGTYELISAQYDGQDIDGLSAELSIYTEVEYALQFEQGPHAGYSQGQFFVDNNTFFSSLTGITPDLSGTTYDLESNGRIRYTSQLDISQEVFNQWGRTLTGAGEPTLVANNDQLTLTSGDERTVAVFQRTSDCTRGWVWHPEGQLSYGSLLPIEGMGMVSETAGNGVLSFHADWLSTLGDPDKPIAPLESELISPEIDLSDANGPVYLRFNEALVYFIFGSPNSPRDEFGFEESTSVSYSIDGGQTWLDTILVNDDVKYSVPALNIISPVGTNLFLEYPFIPHTRLVELPMAAGSANVRIKFNWTGQLYFWAIDDISITGEPESDLALGDFVFYPPSSYQQPVSQIGLDTMFFVANVSNLGTQRRTDVKLKGVVLDPDLNPVWQDSVIIDELPAGYRDSTLVLPNSYAPNIDDTEFEYGIYYELTSAEDDDVNFTDNYDFKNFRAHTDTYAKDNGDGLFGAIFNNNYEMGCYYQLPALAGDGWVVDEVFYSLSTTRSLQVNTPVTTQLYKVKDRVRNFVTDFNFASRGTASPDDDLEIIGGGFARLPAAEGFFDLTANVETPDGAPTPLEPGGRYFVVNVYDANTNSLSHLLDTDIPYFQTSLVLYDETARQWFTNILLTEDGRDGPYNVPVMRMKIRLSTPVDNTPLPETAVNIYPNPTVEQLSLEVNLEEPSPGLVSITNAEGQIMLWQEYQNLQRETLRFNVTSFPAGSYYIRLGTEAGTKTLPFVVTGK